MLWLLQKCKQLKLGCGWARAELDHTCDPFKRAFNGLITLITRDSLLLS